jgi:aminomethyltransferase
MLVSRSGYTGEKGVEFFGPAAAIMPLWEQLLALGVVPVGLGARDTLRLEMGYALYGHELSDTITPLESVAAWTVKWNKSAFIAQEALQAIKDAPNRRHQYGVQLQEGIPRAGYSVWQADRHIGVVTSGSFSPSLKNGIAIAMVEKILAHDAQVAIDIRGCRYPATVVSFPFYSPPH